MFTGHLDNEDFFSQLALLFDARRQESHGSIYLTQKRMSYSTDESMLSSGAPQDPNLSRPMPIIIRATNGKSKDKKTEKIKLSTIVQADALEPFFARYGEVCKAGMNGLKKRNRSRAKEKLKARKKKQTGAGAAAENKIS